MSHPRRTFAPMIVIVVTRIFGILNWFMIHESDVWLIRVLGLVGVSNTQWVKVSSEHGGFCLSFEFVSWCVSAEPTIISRSPKIKMESILVEVLLFLHCETESNPF